MAVALEEIATGVIESAVGPWALVLGAGAVAVALASRSARPLNRMLAASVAAADSAERVTPRAWFRSIQRSVRNLVDEARAEYEAGQIQQPMTAELAADLVTEAGGAAPRNGGQIMLATASAVPLEEADANRRRDTRGRFVRRSRNGTAARD